MSNANEFIIENGVLTKYVGPGGEVAIPENVTSIGNKAFENCKSLVSITIPESVMSIGDSSFSGCWNLSNVTIPGSVTSIGNFAFSNSGLKSITILNGVTRIPDYLFLYCLELTCVSIPDGVTSIGAGAFSGCVSLTSVIIPEGVTSVGDNAFSGCKFVNIIIPDSVTSIRNSSFSGCRSLKSITIPKNVTSIGGNAFKDCISLESITIPESVTSIGQSAFSGCKELADKNGFVIVKGVLYSYYGKDGDIVVPESVTSIGDYAFENCSSLVSITIPNGVTSIGNRVFSGCDNLKTIIFPERLFDTVADLLSGCGKLEAIGIHTDSPESRNIWYAFSAKSGINNLRDFAKIGRWSDYDRELINNGPKYKYKLSARLLGALGRLSHPVELTEENQTLFTDFLNKNAKKLVAVAEEMNRPEILQELLSLSVLDNKTLKAVQKLMATSQDPEIVRLSVQKVEAAPLPKKPKPAASSVVDPLQAEYAEKLKTIKGDAIITEMKLVGNTMPSVRLVDGTPAPMEIFRFILASYGMQSFIYHIDSEADQAAKLLAYDSLCEAIDNVSGHLDIPNYPKVLPLLCRYGNAQQIRALTKAYDEWGYWQIYGKKGRAAQQLLPSALILSDTREAVVWLEKNGGLKAYAHLRGMTVEAVYDRYLYDFGFDETGKRTFDLGITTIEVTLTKKLTFALYDTKKKKAVRTIPKKDIDPVVQKRAADEFTDMRQTLKKVIQIKNNQLLQEYLNGTQQTAQDWKTSYLENPFLHQVAELLVWSQGHSSFLLAESGAVDSAEQPYTITEEPIKIAHPMEMQTDDIAAWQKYFTAHDLKQPFAQVWEPVIDPLTVLPDRYVGCKINPVYLKNQQRRGIDAEWYEREYYEDKHVHIEGFAVEVNKSPALNYVEQDYIEILSLRPITWNRRANMIISYLDRITVWDRVKKDDIRVMDQMGSFTLAQIIEFIAAAQEANANNVLAALLDYKNAHFADFNPMAEFTLDW